MKNRVFNLRQSVFLFIICGFYFSCTPKPQADCGFVQNVYGQRVSWKDNLPVAITIDSSVPSGLRPAIYRAAKTWEHIAGRPLFVFNEKLNKKNSGPERDRKNAIYFLENWDSNNKAEQGRTSVYWVGDEIQEADIRINGEQFAYYNLDPKKLVFFGKRSGSGDRLVKRENGIVNQVLDPLSVSNLSLNMEQDFSSTSVNFERLGYNFEALMLHELGHFLGLKHKDIGISVMETYLAANLDRIALTLADQKNLKCEYGKK